MGTRGLGIFLTILLSAAPAGARPLSDRALLSRCYSQLTGTKLSAKDPLWDALKTDKAQTICVNLLNSVQFDNSGVVNGALQQKILKQFNDFHRGWVKKQAQSTFELGEGLYGTVDIHDPGEPALFVTRALFSGTHYREVLRGFHRLEAVRDNSTATASGSPSGFKRPSRYIFGSYDGEPGLSNLNSESVIVPTVNSLFQTVPFVTAPVPLVQVGALTGLRVRSGVASVPGLLTLHSGSSATLNENGLVLPHDIRHSFGGGAIGSQPFLLYNFGHGFSYQTDGARKLPRSWAQAAMQTYLCTPEPYLRSADVGTFKSDKAAAPPFRKETSCLQCHVTLDQAAMAARNITPASTSIIPAVIGRATATMASYRANERPGGEFWPSEPAANFRFQEPAGRLIFRSFTGALVDRTVVGVEGLGQAMSETEDFYACAAKRYFEFFTGLKIPLADVSGKRPGDPVFEKEQRWREFVIALGRELRLTGSLRNMIKRILESDQYRLPDYGKGQ